MKSPKFPNIFAQYQPLTGRDWLRSLDPETRKAFAGLGYAQHLIDDRNIHVIGGKARAKSAQRGHRGRFVKG